MLKTRPESKAALKISGFRNQSCNSNLLLVKINVCFKHFSFTIFRKKWSVVFSKKTSLLGWHSSRNCSKLVVENILQKTRYCWNHVDIIYSSNIIIVYNSTFYFIVVRICTLYVPDCVRCDRFNETSKHSEDTLKKIH